jgi:hypothetical protein
MQTQLLLEQVALVLVGPHTKGVTDLEAAVAAAAVLAVLVPREVLTPMAV